MLRHAADHRALETVRQSDRVFKLPFCVISLKMNCRSLKYSSATCCFPGPQAESRLHRWCCRDSRSPDLWRRGSDSRSYEAKRTDRHPRRWRWRCGLPAGRKLVVFARQHNFDPHSRLSLAANFLATHRTRSFSATPPSPMAPGSLPPWPGSKTILRMPGTVVFAAWNLFSAAAAGN